MSGSDQTVRVLDATRRRGTSPRGFPITVEYLVEGEPGTETVWLDEFLEEYCPSVTWPDTTEDDLKTDGGRIHHDSRTCGDCQLARETDGGVR